MMNAILRPELIHVFWRWREAAFGLFMALCGMFWAVSQQGILAAVGTSLAIVGSLIIFAGMQRTRFRVSSATDVGVVQVADRHVTYYGPRDGGSVAVDALEIVELDPTMKPACWRLTESGGQPLTIPTNADGAEQLFDVFAGLDGIKTENMLSRLRANPQTPVVIWHESLRQVH